MTKVEAIALHKNPLAMVFLAEREAGAAAARFQLAVLASIDLDAESPASRAKLEGWQRALRSKAGGLFERIEALERQHGVVR